MRQSFSVGRIFGIDVRIHATWLLAFAFVTWGLANGYFRFVAPRGAGPGLPLALGAIAALLLFLSVLIHEFSHSLVAQSLGLRVKDITLFIFGGVSNIAGEAHSARDEFLVSVVGPLTSFGLAAFFWAISVILGGAPGLSLLTGSVAGLRGTTPAIAILNYLAAINLLLGAFNLVPAFPLDGGRVFRSIVWAVTKRFGRATLIATTVGQVFAFLMIGLGVVRFAFGDLLGGLWTVVIGWFLFQAAGASRQERGLREGLNGIPVGAVMDPAVPAVSHSTTVQQLVYDYLLRSERRRVIVVKDGAPVGIVEPSAVNSVPRDAWATTPVQVIAAPVPFTVTPEADAGELLSHLENNELVPVTIDGHVVGAVDIMRLMRYAQLRKELRAHVGTVRPSTA